MKTVLLYNLFLLLVIVMLIAGKQGRSSLLMEYCVASLGLYPINLKNTKKHPYDQTMRMLFLQIIR